MMGVNDIITADSDWFTHTTQVAHIDWSEISTERGE